MKHEPVLTSACCGLIALGALAVAAWTVLTGQIAAQGLDALFLIVVALLIAAAFGAVPLLAYRQGFLPKPRRQPAVAQAKSPPASSAAAATEVKK